jgi:AraC-like DNA-binding protein
MPQIPIRHIKGSFFDERFSVKNVADLVAEADMFQELHRHDFYFILFIREGKGEHEIDFIKYDVGDYSVFFMRPGQVHQLRLEKGASGFIVEFTPDFYAPHEDPSSFVLRKVSHKNLCRLSTERFDRISSLLHSIYQEFTQKQDRYKEVVKASLEILFIELVRQSPNPHKIPNGATLFAQERLEELQDLMEKNISTKKQVSQYAEMLNVTPYQLNAITKTSLKKTCSELINDQIILEARRLLIATTDQVNQIADVLGYEDPSYFIRFFKKHTGFSPEAFRQNFR